MKLKSAPHSVSQGPVPNGPPQAPPGKAARPQKPPFKFVLFFRRLFQRLRQGRNYVPPNAVTYELAVKQFLGNILGVTARMYPAWLKTIRDGLTEYNSGDNRQTDIDAQYPLDDFFFAGFVALEASRIPALYEHAEADLLFSTIADQLDVVANRHDRVVSDLFFEIIARLNLMQAVPTEKRPYDKVVKVILKRLGFDATDAGKTLLADKAFRQLLAEPFALHAPQWWEKFKTQFVLYAPKTAEGATEDDDQKAMAELIAKTEAARKEPKRRWRKRAESIFG